MKTFPRRLVVVVTLLTALVARATLGIEWQMQLGNPSEATADSTNHTRYLIQRAQYALDYNDTLREANWVSWNLTTDDLGASSRSNFAVDPTLPAGFYRVRTTDYVGSGFDRGHVCPSADRTLTAADNQVTFYMSNMVPQTPDNNQGVWASFEAYCRTLANAGHELLIVSGPSGFSGPRLASGVAVPAHTWKIVVVVLTGPAPALTRIDEATRVIAIKVPNIQGVRSNPWQDFVTSAGQIETDTGFTFFRALPPATAAALRAKVDGQPPVAASRLVNVSSRTVAGAGESSAIAGFVLADGAPASVLVRAVGPGLRDFGVAGPLAAPRLEVLRGETSLATNTDWRTADNSSEIAAAATRSGAFPLGVANADSALLVTLPPGNYTAIASAANGAAGVALVEVYPLTADAGGPVARPVNLSTRGFAGAGDATLIAGFVLEGAAPRRILFRAIGPALAGFGVPGFLARPRVSLLRGEATLAENAGWSTSSDAAEIAEVAGRAGAFALPAGSADAALLLTLAPGAYTAHVSGADGGNGIALAEIYEVP